MPAPVWEKTYLLEGYDPRGALRRWRWEGCLKIDNLLLEAPLENDPPNIGVDSRTVIAV